MLIKYKDDQNNTITVNADSIAVVVPSPLSPIATGLVIFPGGSSKVLVEEAERLSKKLEDWAVVGRPTDV